MRSLAQDKDAVMIREVYTTEYFSGMVRDKCITDDDGVGYYHDGEKLLDIRVDLSCIQQEVRRGKYHPYVVWFESE